jgi:G:T-mismatch repair DNA endonuclease (very short patch repair protein)
VRANIVGGPSIIFCRYQEKDTTRIREHEYGQQGKLCKEVLGCDANALYLWSMMQTMPTGSPIRRQKWNNFIPTFVDKFGRTAWKWLEYMAFTTNSQIEHKFNSGEKKIGRHGLPVDGYCSKTKTVYQFHGCLFHGHDCDLTQHTSVNPINLRPLTDLDEETKSKEHYIRSLGYTLITIYECEWYEMVRSSPKIREFVEDLERHSMSKNRAMSEQEIILALENEDFFGLIECDISVPENLHDHFSEMCPIFKNALVTRDHLSSSMKSFAEKNGLLKSPQRMLIGSLHGEQILLLTPLAKWYLSHGLKITKIHQIVQYIPQKCFERFGYSVCDARREGDVDSSEALLADTSELIGSYSHHLFSHFPNFPLHSIP